MKSPKWRQSPYIWWNMITYSNWWHGCFSDHFPEGRGQSAQCPSFLFLCTWSVLMTPDVFLCSIYFYSSDDTVPNPNFISINLFFKFNHCFFDSGNKKCNYKGPNEKTIFFPSFFSLSNGNDPCLILLSSLKVDNKYVPYNYKVMTFNLVLVSNEPLLIDIASD